MWYALTASSDGAVIVDVSASTYSAGVIVVTGSPGSFSLVTCGPGSVAFSTVSGETYALLAFDDQPGAGNGGTLTISVDEAPPPPTVSLTVDPTGHFNKVTGSATVTGTVLCTGVADFTFIDVQLSQQVGRVATVSGFGETGFTCDGTTQPWSVEVFPFSGLFKGGKAASVTVAVACGVLFCGSDQVTRSISLRSQGAQRGPSSHRRRWPRPGYKRSHRSNRKGPSGDAEREARDCAGRRWGRTPRWGGTRAPGQRQRGGCRVAPRANDFPAEAVVPNVSGSRFIVYLNKAPSVSVSVAWMAVN